MRYVYIDVVDFTEGRSVEAQSDILACLSQVVGQAVMEQIPLGDQVLFLPTGDGVCVCLVNLIHPFDLDIQIALSVLEKIHAANAEQVDVSRRFEVRVGVNENQDNLILDIKGGVNVVGLGINMAQRVMSLAGPSRLLLGQAVYERLSQRELYRHWLSPLQAIVKHGRRLQCYEYFNPALACFARHGLRVARNPMAEVKPAAPVVELPLSGGPQRTRARRQRPAPSFRIGS